MLELLRHIPTGALAGILIYLAMVSLPVLAATLAHVATLPQVRKEP